MSYPPDPKTSALEGSYSTVPLDAIGKLASKAPPEIIGLLARISDEEQIKDDDWWRLLENVVQCIEHIGDRDVYDELQLVNGFLSRSYQDYKTWYSVRKALAAINPSQMPFNQPAADVLYSVGIWKGSRDSSSRKWLQPLVELGDQAIADIEWALRFENVRMQDTSRQFVAVDALGEIGSDSAAAVLRQYIKQQSSPFEIERRRRHSNTSVIRMSFVALLKAEPNEATAKEIVENSQLLNRTHLRHLVDNIGDTSQDKIPERVKIAFCKFVLLDADMQNSNNQYAANNAANFLADIGGQKTGDILSSVLLNPTTNINIKSAAARALGTIKNYDSIPTLIKASKINGVPIGVIAEAMGTISDPRAIPALKDMAQYDRINRPDKLWIAAALARFDQNYEENAKIIRELLPSSMSQAAWLDDSKTIKALTIYAQNPTTYFGNRAVKSLEVVESSESLQTLAILAEEEPLNTLHLQIFSAAASRLAKKLQHPSEAYWTSVLSVTAAIRAWFTTSQNIRPEPRNRQSFAVILENPSLARRVWIAEVTRRLDVAAPKNKDDYRTNIPIHALIAVEDIFGTDLVPVLKRIITESHDKISHNGKLSKVDFYHLRSRAAKILTDKTGQQYTFVDVDGRTHPGGWHPSQEE